MSRDASSDPWPINAPGSSHSLLCNGGSMAITITCIPHTHFNSAQDTFLTANKYGVCTGLPVPLWIIFVSLHNNLSLELSQKWPQYLFVPHRQPGRQTQNRRRVKCSPTWSLALSTEDRTLLLFILLICFGEIFYCSSSSTLKVCWPITRNGAFTGDCTTRTCVSCSILSQIMRNCKYSKYTKISNAIKYKRSLYITYLHEMRRERLFRYLFYVLLFIQNLFRIVNTNA